MREINNLSTNLPGFELIEALILHTIMLQKKRFIQGASLVLGLAIAGAGATSAFAYGFGTSTKVDLTDAQKAIVTQAQALREEGKIEETHTLLEANDLKGFGRKAGARHMMQSMTDEDRATFEAQQQAHREAREAMREAIENNDYQTFVATRAGDTNAPEVTVETFAKMVQAHTLREAGDIEGARAIMEEIGFPMRDGHGKGMGGPGLRGGSLSQGQ